MNNGRIAGSGTPAELADMARGGQVILITIRAQRDHIDAALGALPFVTAITHISEQDGLHSYSLTTTADKDVSERIFNAVVHNGWSLAELQRKAINLEEVFLDLTTREDT